MKTILNIIYTRYFALLLVVLMPVSLLAQKTSLSGYIRDAATGESLIAATVHIKEADQSAVSNNYGFYSVSVPQGKYTVIFSYVGYSQKEITIDLSKNQSFNAEMVSSTEMKEVKVTSARKDENVKNTEMGTITLSMARIKELPVLFGEVDILKTLQLLPGVQSAGEGNSGFYVRGGGPDQNLVLLDDAVVYNTGHLFGFFSVFNSDAIKDVTLIKGGPAANYGGRLSSVVDVYMKEGNMKEYHAEGGIGLIASRLSLQGPIKKDKGSFIVSGRRTYIDVLAKPFTDKLKNTGYYFYDANMKANYKLGKHDRIYLSGYMGVDKFKFQSPNGNFKADIPWGNQTATFRWNHQFNDKLFVNTALVYNDYNFASNFNQNTFSVKLASGIKDYNAKSDFDYYTSYNHHFKAGVAYTHHTFIPNQISGQVDTIKLDPNNAFTKYAHETGAYILDDFEPTKWWKINVGLRYSWFGQTGPYMAYTYDANGKATDSTKYGSGNIVKAYGGWEPRFNMRFELNDNSSIKTSIAKTYQYIHLVSNNGSTLPTDVWAPSTLLVNPQKAWQYSAGYFHNFLDNKLETSVEVYYKDMKNQIQYKDGYTPNSLEDPERSYVFGTGTAYGAEFFINKTQGKFTGWIGYTLAWTYEKFPGLNNGESFPNKYDRRHDISVVGSYKFNKKWNVSSVFVYGSGNAITLPTAYYFVNGSLREYFSKVNAFRLPSYHRLDISATYTPQHSKPHRWEGSWTFSVYNVYDHHNPYFLYVDNQGTASTGIKVTVYEVYILPILPSITYNFKF
ncbi:MAG: TonB-dependent receptor [Flavipsychrobacter sp.]|nr:TonB-dependent receptor [Flavipsychrobacter sp.]